MSDKNLDKQQQPEFLAIIDEKADVLTRIIEGAFKLKKILIVEDQVDILNLLKKVLETEDRKFFLAECGEDALKVARQTIPDLILLDVMFPGGLDGYEVT